MITSARDHPDSEDAGIINRTELEVIPCSHNPEFSSKYGQTLGASLTGLYCLADYRAFQLNISRESFDSEDNNLSITFQPCTGKSFCLDRAQIETFLTGKEFWFPFEQANVMIGTPNLLDLGTDLEYSMSKASILRVPLLPGLQNSLKVTIQGGVVSIDNFTTLGFVDNTAMKHKRFH